jgi:hypothetical protein
MIDIAAGEACVFQAKADRALRELMRVIPVGLLAVLDTVESFLLGGCDELAVDEQRSRGLVIHRVNSKDVYHSARFLSLFGLLARHCPDNG